MERKATLPGNPDPEKIDIDMLIVIGMTRLNNTEKEIRRMTLRTFLHRHKCYMKLNGYNEKEKEETVEPVYF